MPSEHTQIVPSTNNVNSVIDKIIKQNQYVSDMSDLIMSLIRASAPVLRKRWFGRTYYITPDYVHLSGDTYEWRYNLDRSSWIVIRDDGKVGKFSDNHGEWGFGIFFSLVGCVAAKCGGIGNWIYIIGVAIIIFCIYKIQQFKPYGETNNDANVPIHLSALYDEISDIKLLEIPTYE